MLLTLPRTRSTNMPPAPCTAYAPALPVGSPIPTYHSIISSVSDENVTSELTVSATVRPPSRNATPVCTRWVRPDNRRNMERASSSSSGLPRMSPPKSTVVSAAITNESNDADIACAFSTARRRTYGMGASAGRGASSMSGIATVKSIRSCLNSSWRRGDAEARTMGGRLILR